MRELMGDLINLTISGWSAFWVFFYSAFCFLQAGFMREQVCKYMCPYARFQSVMFDPDTLIVTYDEARGEPRGARRKTDDLKAKGLGDCVDCKVCVQVCPTGIDIRNGLQYECIGCGLCIDACNEIMVKMDYKPGLIRYDAEKLDRQKLHIKANASSHHASAHHVVHGYFADHLGHLCLLLKHTHSFAC